MTTATRGAAAPPATRQPLSPSAVRALRAPSAPRTPPRYATTRRGDLQGLRGIAVLLVVLYHADVPLLHGGFLGVDVFFVLSGFLITSLLLAELERTRHIGLVSFFARRARRLLPASTLVLVVTGLAGLLVLDPAPLRELGEDLRWAGLFSANWHFVVQGTDYMAQDRSESALLHFWSLGVEEQFYVVWPLLLLATVFLATGRDRARRMPGPGLLAGVLGAVVVVSFVAQLLVTDASQPLAFFGSPTRAWQLGLGGLLAVAVPFLAGLRPAGRTVVAVVGAVLLLTSLVVLDEDGGPTGPYPGWGALLPTSAALLLIAAGTGGRSPALAPVVEQPLLRWFGDISYSLYLWHWPLLVLLPVALGTDAGWVAALAVGTSVGLAVLTQRLVEDPVRHSLMRRRTSLALGAALVCGVLAVALVVQSVGDDRADQALVVTGASGSPVALRPHLADASEGLHALTDLGCAADYAEVSVGTCEFGAPDGERTVVLLGDSQAGILHHAMDEAAAARGWRLVSLSKPGCPAADVTKFDPQRSRPFTECDQFRQDIWQRVAKTAPDLVVVASAWNPSGSVQARQSGNLLTGPAAREATVAGWVRTLRVLQETGADVVLADGPPRAGLDTSACLLEKRDVGGCTFAEPEPAPSLDAVAQVPSVDVLDLYSEVCSAGTCTPVVDDMLVYGDSTHMTKTYVMSRVPDLVDLLESR